MKRLLEKLQSRNGSVLFLVVVVMSLLIIAASATYYVVSNQSSSVTVRYNSEQSYQTARSMSGAVSQYINGYLNAIKASGEKSIGKYSNTVVGKMLKGETVTTKDLDLKAMGLSENDDATVNITIKPSGTKVEGDNTVNFYEIEVSSQYNGETTKVTQIIAIETGPAEYFTRFLTSTGNRSEDVIVSAEQILSGAYFENDFTRLSSAHMNDSVYVTGTFDDDGIIYHRSLYSSRTEIVVNENFYCKGAGGSVVDVDEVYVGGNLLCAKQILADNVYVLGDYTCNMSQGASSSTFYIDGDCYLNSGTTNDSVFQTFYINGDLYLNNISESHGKFYVKGNVIIPGKTGHGTTKGIECGGKFLYADGTEVNPGDGGSFAGEPAPTKWYSNFKFTHADKFISLFNKEKVADVVNHISNNTSKNKYAEWDAEGYFTKTFPGAPTIDPGDAAYKLSEYGNDFLIEIDKSCRLIPAKGWGNWGSHYIEIDATEKDIYIYLDSNGLKVDERKCFKFSETEETAPVNVVVKGTHSVIFILPADTDFRLDSRQFIGHRGLAEYMTGKTGDDLRTVNVRDSFIPGNTDKIRSLLIKGENDAEILDRSKLSDNQTHNNIFLVTKGTSNRISVGRESTLCGYIYAPSTVMNCDYAGQTIGFVGGLIMGSYTYKNMNATLAFTTPYDYDSNYGGKKTDIVKQLMSISVSGSPDPGSAKEFKDSYVVGYK